jgi:hypothetical protein
MARSLEQDLTKRSCKSVGQEASRQSPFGQWIAALQCSNLGVLLR